MDKYYRFTFRSRRYKFPRCSLLGFAVLAAKVLGWAAAGFLAYALIVLAILIA